MLYNIIVGSIVVVALVIVLFLVIKKLPRLKTLDIETVPEEKEARVRDRILIDRMRRRAIKSRQSVGKLGAPVWEKIKLFFSNIYHKIVELEKRYQKESAKNSHGKELGFEEKIKMLMLEAQDFIKNEQLVTAEKKYIEVVSLSPGNNKAYRGLADIYFLQKEYEQAIQTLKYLVKLNLKACKPVAKRNEVGKIVDSCANAEDLSDDFIRLAEAYFAKSDYNNSLTNLKKALIYTPNDPKSLDLIIDVCIMMKNKALALNYFNKLSKINPENQKLLEYRKKLNEM